MHDVLSGDHSRKFGLGSNGKAAAKTKCLGRNFNAGSGLLALVFASIDHLDYSPHQRKVEVMIRGDLFGRVQVLDIIFQDRIENIVRAASESLSFWSARSSAEGGF